MHSELVSNLTTTEFIKSFRILNSRRVQPQTVYSDNAKTFKVGVKWLANINKDQKLHDILSSETVIWKFNLPKAPWWGWSIWTANWPNIGKAQLTWAELEKVLLDIEIILNSRPLTYMAEEVDHPILTLNSLILERHTWWKWK